MSDVFIATKMNVSSEETQVTQSCNCLFCRMKDVLILNRYIPWITLSRIFFLSLMTLYPSKNYFSVKTDIPDFIQSHWAVISKLSQFSEGGKWRKSMLDAINHSRYFESGKVEYHVSGFWKLKDTSIPFVENWLASDEQKEEYCVNETSISSEPSVFNLGMNTQKQQTGSTQTIVNYYIYNISVCKGNILTLINLYNTNTDLNLRQRVVEEIKHNEIALQHYTEALYKNAEVDNPNYSSACFMVRTVF
ncbi:hypothetical protein EIN_097210 [Entamoeba invadens IP1]|uniref:Uncharacterized protein n=1 Tax=Entamoeba invadens IP1 TaxID=370355 RepID=A0A0A1U0N1_ENTIV|nr:hypothetical protein EIN_097210 [Entamoeba invadens IP1]ELP87454.1 hypothetical protein EIN_097210 [Entamoeba invadens IP1]|eukprot:XP_004254225.1 hypothetical protein EIN_097210 [Entamoeba invadens IP1]